MLFFFNQSGIKTRTNSDSPNTCFPALGTSCLFSRTWHRCLVFPCTGCFFPALGSGCLFSRAWHRLLVFPRLSPVSCFLALGTGCLFSRSWHQLPGCRFLKSLYILSRNVPAGFSFEIYKDLFLFLSVLQSVLVPEQWPLKRWSGPRTTKLLIMCVATKKPS